MEAPIRRIGPRRRGADEASDAVVYLTASLLIWLFGALVFMPMASRIEPTRTPVICSLIILIPFSISLVKGYSGLGGLLDAAAEALTQEWMKSKAERRGSMEETRRRFRLLLELVALLVIFLLYSPLLSAIHPSLTGIAAIITLLAALCRSIRK